MPFQKGVSGNPSGRPKKLDGLAELILEKTEDGKLLVKKLFEIMTTAEETRDQIAAMKLLFEYGFGKPKESLEVSGEIGLGQMFEQMVEKQKQIKLVS